MLMYGSGTPIEEQRRRLRRVAAELLGVQADAQPWSVRYRQVAVRVQDEGLVQQPVHAGAAADVLDEIRIQRRRELEVRGEAQRRIPAVADIADAEVARRPGDAMPPTFVTSGCTMYQTPSPR